MQWACRYKCDTEEVTENQPSPHLFQAYICLLIYLGFKQYEYSELKLEPQKNQTVTQDWQLREIKLFPNWRYLGATIYITEDRSKTTPIKYVLILKKCQLQPILINF